MFGALGNILFDVINSPESFSSKHPYDYAEQKVVEAAPILQWLSNGLEQISLNILLHVSFTQPQARYDELTAAAEAHGAMPLVLGNGEHRGYFVITEIAETWRQCADDGSPMAIALNLTLREWVQSIQLSASAPPVPATPPPAVVSAAPSASSPTFDPTKPVSAHNLLPIGAVFQLHSAGVDLNSIGPISPVVNNPGATGPATPAQMPDDVPAATILRSPS